MRILLFSTLYPNAAAPAHGIFVENRIAAYRKKYDADIKVIAPVPWFPIEHPFFDPYANYARVPEREIRHGMEVLHPRYAVLPKAAMRIAPMTLTAALRKSVRALINDGWVFDFIDAHYFYPDGVAAKNVAREFGKPFLVTARGSDVTLLPSFDGPRKRILDTARRADAIVTVASALKETLSDLGAPREKIRVLRNGVDLTAFYRDDRVKAREGLGVEGLVLASVGHLIDRKGHGLAVKALKHLPDATLLIAGAGPDQSQLQRLAKNCGLEDRVRFLGLLDTQQLRGVYNAADVLVLASSREGWANVLLEAMACGAPCVASDVGGSSEVVRAPEAGRIISERTPEAIAAAVRDIADAGIDREATQAFAERHSWDETVAGMHSIFSELREKSRAAAKIKTTPIDLTTSADRPRLIITVDTEEQFDWRRFDQPEIHQVNEMDGLEEFQTLCAKFKAAPLYFLTWPMLKNKTAVGFFNELKLAGDADAGLHFHQWVTPPGDYPGEFFSFQKNLPDITYRAKLSSLAHAFAEAFGERAIAHRAGRYGIGQGDYGLLAEAGITHDFSPSAGFDFSARGGPDFSGMSNLPFAVSGDDWRVNVTPVTGGRALRRTRMFLPDAEKRAGFAGCRPDRHVSLTRALRLSPEGAGLDELKALTRRLIADETPVMTFTLHSTSLTPGANIYARDEEDVNRLLNVTSQYLTWFRDALGGQIISLSALCALYERTPLSD